MNYGMTRLLFALGCLSLTAACVIVTSDDDPEGTTGMPGPTTGNAMPGTDESTTGEVAESSSSSGMADSSTGADSTSTGDGGDSNTGKPEGACQPEGNFGACSAPADCPTLQGQLGLQPCFETSPGFNSCAAPCEIPGDCGNSEEFGGATARCLETGAFSQCFLTCSSTDDCPCDLECQPLEFDDSISVCTAPA